MVQVLVRITVGSGQTRQLVEALRTLMRAVERDGSCSNVYTAVDVEHGETVWYCEEWSDAAAFERHARSDSFARLLALVEVAAAPPQLECRVVTEVRGLDYLETVRGVATQTPPAAQA